MTGKHGAGSVGWLQLELGLSDGDLIARLRSLGLPATIPIVLHTNTTVLVTRTVKGALRVHRGFASAPDDVLRAVVAWARPGIRSAVRRLAERALVTFPVHRASGLDEPPPERRRPESPRPGDDPLVARLLALHTEYNARHFEGRLAPVAIRLSSRMRRQLGDFRPAEGPAPAQITLSRRHLRRDGWRRAAVTLLHEMVHQWQAETGKPLAHDAAFRRRCAALGIDGGAVARVDGDLPPSFLPAARHSRRASTTS